VHSVPHVCSSRVSTRFRPLCEFVTDSRLIGPVSPSPPQPLSSPNPDRSPSYRVNPCTRWTKFTLVGVVFSRRVGRHVSAAAPVSGRQASPFGKEEKRRHSPSVSMLESSTARSLSLLRRRNRFRGGRLSETTKLRETVRSDPSGDNDDNAEPGRQ